jgi:hypothetical protein
VFYYIVLFIFFLFSFYSYFVNRKLEKKLYYLLVVLLCFIAGFRYETGNDWYIYEVIFENTLEISVLFSDPNLYISHFNDIEIGYKILNSLVLGMGGDVQVIFLLTNVFSFYVLSKFINRYSNYRILSLLIYYSIFYLNFNMSIIRQGIALSFFLLAFNYLVRRQSVKYFMVAIIASLFHVSALVLIPIYFVYHLRYSRTFYAVLVGTAIFIRIFEIKILFYFSSLIPAFIMSDLTHYFENNISDSLISFGNLERILMVGLILIFGSAMVKKREEYHIFISMYVIYVALNFVLYENEAILSRIRFYLQISYILILPMFIEVVKKQLTKCLVVICIFIFSAIPLVNFLSNEMNQTLYNPYQNVVIHKYLLNIDSDGRYRSERILQNIKNN